MIAICAGQCECGRTRFELTGARPPHVYACHCMNCQTRSGSAFAEHAMIDASQFTCRGETVSYLRAADGIEFEEVFCANCYTRLYNRNSALPGMIFLRAGTLSDSERLKPIAHIWTSRKQPWVEFPAGTPLFPQSPTPEQFGEAVAKAERET